MSIGLKSKTVFLEPHQEEWEEEGKRICAEIKEILRDDVVDVQHVGSTSIRGIYRKEDYPGQHLYRCGDFENQIITHYIHVVLVGSYQWQNYINFRDYLNTHEEAAKRYEKS